MTTKYVLMYEAAPERREQAQLHFPAHRQRLEQFHARGVLLMVGPLGNPPTAAMGIFTTREAAEEFAREDPFVLNGVVKTWVVHEWGEIFA